MGNFSDIINKWVEDTEETINDILQTVAIKVGESVVRLSPVDTGRFRGNWQMTIDTLATSSLLRYDKEGDMTIADIASKANSFTAGQMAYIQNHVLYGHDLEYGSSQQSEGMVRITTASFKRIVDQAVLLNK